MQSLSARLKRLSLPRKLIAITLLTSVLPLVLAFDMLILKATFDFRKDLETELAILGDVTGTNTAAALVFNDVATATKVLQALKAHRQVHVACLYDEAGRKFVEYDSSEGAGACPPHSDLRPFGAHGKHAAVTRNVALDGERIGTIYLEAGLDGISSRLKHYILVIAVVLLSGIGVVAVLSTRLQRIVSDPILDLARDVKLVSDKKDYSIRAHKRADDEVGTLIDAFNGMLGQIEEHAGELTRINEELVEAQKVSDATARALAESERRFHATFDDAPIGMNLVDAEGKLVEANHSLQQLLGFSREEIRNVSFAAFTHPDDLPLDLECFSELVNGVRKRYQLEKRYICKDGKTLWVRLTVSRLVIPDGGFLGIAMAEDITQRKQLEEQFRQAQKMEAIGRLAGGVAHDFNNLLTVIKGNTELLIRRTPGENPIQKNLGQVRKASDRAAALVDQLLAFSRKQMVDARVLDLNALIHDLEKMLARLIREDIELVTKLDDGALWVKADPVQLEQILLNLGVNARDAMPHGGRLAIATRSVRFERAPERIPDMIPGYYVELTVQDTGIGMSEETRLRIFEPFFTTKEVGKGTGLGLSTVYGIIQQTDAYITVDSQLDHGSTFTIYFPRLSQPPRGEVPRVASDAAPMADRETILVVEDEEMVRSMICETLEERGYHVLEAHHPEHALQLAERKEHDIRLLLTDVVMPRLNGRELANRIDALRPGLKVLFISGYTEQAVSMEGEFLKKPFTPDELASKVRSVLADSLVGA